MARSSAPGGRGRDQGSGSGRRERRRASRPPTNRRYPRTARLNTLLHQIVADHLERVDDDRLGFLTVTGVEVDSDLNRAEVFVSALDQEPSPETDRAYLEVLAEYRKPIQAQIAAQARIRKTPEVVFAFDPGVRAGARIEEILAGLEPGPEGQTDGPADGDAGNEAGEPPEGA